MNFNSTLLRFQRIVEFVITCCGKLAGFVQGCKLRGEDRGFSPATLSVSPGYFHRKQKENRNKRIS